MDAFLWILLPILVAAGSAILSFYVMQSRMEVMLAKERECGQRRQLQTAILAGEHPG